MSQSTKYLTTKPRKKVRICLQAPDGTLHPILWFRNPKPDEILWSPYGVRSKSCTLHSLFPDELIGPDDINPRRYHFKNFVEINKPVDHFSSHVDGTFHLKGKHPPPIYSHSLRMRENLGANSPVFLEFIVRTEVAAEYCTKSRSRGPGETIVIMGENGAGVEICGAVAGDSYDIEGFIMAGLNDSWSRGPIFVIGSFKGALATRPVWPNCDLISNRPRGTLVTLRFLLENGSFRHKVFLFN